MDTNVSAPASELDASMARLSELEKSLPDYKPPGATVPDASATPAGNRAPAAGKDGASTPTQKSQASTPSDAEAKAKAELDTAEAEAAKEGQEIKRDDKGEPARGADGKFIKQPKTAAPAADPNKDGKQGSKFAQNQQRLQGSWKELNAAKDALTAERAKVDGELKSARAKFDADVAEFQRQKQEAAASQTPEAYEKMAIAEQGKAVKLEEAAKAAEGAGEFDKADRLRELAVVAKGFEKLARQKAADLKANPPPDAGKLQAQRQAADKEWMLKGATDFPEFGKKESPTQKEAVGFLKNLTEQFPKLANLPERYYFSAMFADLKVKAAAADRVPGLEKEVGDLKAKVTELEALTNPTPGGGVARLPGEKTFEQMSPEEQYAQLRADAQGR